MYNALKSSSFSDLVTNIHYCDGDYDWAHPFTSDQFRKRKKIVNKVDTVLNEGFGFHVVISSFLIKEILY